MYISKKMITDEEVEFEQGVFVFMADDTRDLVKQFLRIGLADKIPKEKRVNELSPSAADNMAVYYSTKK